MKALVTAGPTYEPIDPVRFIGNHSSGKMGIAIADELASKGFEVTLIIGPVSLKPAHPQIKQIPVATAAEMFNACVQYFSLSDVIVFAAAVADYTPKHPSSVKIKKKEDQLLLELVRTKDIAATMGKLKSNNQVTLGFALETDNEMSNAGEKLRRKNFDFIVLNRMQDAGAGFGYDTNKIAIIDYRGNVANFELKSKTEVAKDIVNYISKIIKEKKIQ